MSSRVVAFLCVVFLSAPAVSSAENVIAKAVKGDLVQVQEGKVKSVKDYQPIQDAKVFGLYFSAQWCPPCRAFTPKLVDFYNQVKPKHSEFDLIFISSDRSEDAMEAYMVDYKMPWPAVAFSDLRRLKTIPDLKNGRGIPNLVFVTAEGKVLAKSYNDEGKYTGPTRVIKEIQKYLNSDSAAKTDDLAQN